MAAETFEEWAHRIITEARAMDWRGFTNQLISRSRTAHVYSVTKPAHREWPSRELVACWCDDFGINFGSGISIDGDKATVAVCVD